jgi:hypothetical protein
VDVVGYDWQVIATVEALFRNDSASLKLPAGWEADRLQRVDRGAGARRMEGYWPSTANDPTALVATLTENIIVWKGDRKIGRIFLTDWPGEGSSLRKMYLNCQYADRPFTLDGFQGRNSAFIFNQVAFRKGWNVYAKYNVGESQIEIKTDISATADLNWRFEQWP